MARGKRDQNPPKKHGNIPCDGAPVPQDPRRQPRRDRGAGHARLPRDGDPHRWPSISEPDRTGAARAPGRRGAAGRTRARRASRTCASTGCSTRRGRAGPTPCTPATASSPRTRTSRARARRRGSDLHRPAQRDDRAHGREDLGPARSGGRAGVPVVPGTLEPLADEAELARAAERIGYPVMLKAAAGGGGKGMRLVSCRGGARPRRSRAARSRGPRRLRRRQRLPREGARPARATSRSRSSADHHGNVVHLFERECSIQRRHQKVIEETPVPARDARPAARMGEAAVALVARSRAT